MTGLETTGETVGILALYLMGWGLAGPLGVVKEVFGVGL